MNNMAYLPFLNLFTEILNKHGPIKQKYLRAYQKRTKTTKLLHKLLKKQEEHLANLDMNFISDNKNFWQIVKRFSSNKVKAKITTKLVENNKMIDDEIEISKLFNEYFLNIVRK